MSAYDNLLALIIILGLGVIFYLKITNKTLTDLYREIKEIISPEVEE